ncbi:MAG: hypothetical protein CMK07_14665 [Ponticaulis sp.]|nr:hypothetical protein [Ponticaulis sp.]
MIRIKADGFLARIFSGLASARKEQKQAGPDLLNEPSELSADLTDLLVRLAQSATDNDVAEFDYLVRTLQVFEHKTRRDALVCDHALFIAYNIDIEAHVAGRPTSHENVQALRELAMTESKKSVSD